MDERSFYKRCSIKKLEYFGYENAYYNFNAVFEKKNASSIYGGSIVKKQLVVDYIVHCISFNDFIAFCKYDLYFIEIVIILFNTDY